MAAFFIAGGAIAAAIFGGGLLGGGDNYAENIVDAVVDVSTEVLNQTILDVGTQVDLGTWAKFKDCYVSNSTFRQSIVVDISAEAMQYVANSTEVKQSIDVNIDQIAEAIAEGLGITSGSNEAKNTIKIAQDAKTAITNKTLLDCSQVVNARSRVDCEGSTIRNSVVDQAISLSIFKRCFQQAANGAKIEQDMSASFKQAAESKTQTSLIWVALIVSAVLAIIVVAGQTGKVLAKRLTDWKFIVAVTPIFLISTYLAVAKTAQLWPFNFKQMLMNNPNLEAFVYVDTVAISPLELFRQKYADKYDSIAYVQRDVEIEKTGKTTSLKTYDITTPSTNFEIALRKRPSPLAECGEGQKQCPNTTEEGGCCTSLDHCDPLTGLCGK